ncbi:MAG: pilus assembly protein PilM [Planctomycetota bacterium]
MTDAVPGEGPRPPLSTSQRITQALKRTGTFAAPGGGVGAGLDLGRASLKLVRRLRDGSVCAAERAVDPRIEGAAREEALHAALLSACEEVGLRAGAQVHVAVPRATAILKQLTLPEVGPEELPDLLRFQASKSLPFELHELALTWGELGPDPAGGRRYVLAAVRNPTLMELRALVERAGLVPDRLEVSSQAAARLVPDGPGEVLLVDVGHATSDILLLKDGSLVYSRSASVGLGSEGWQERLPQEVSRSLVAARSEGGRSDRGGPPDRLYIAGGGAGDATLLDALERALRIAPEPLVPAGVPDPTKGARLVVACGLVEPPRAGIPYLDLAQRARAEAAASSRRRLTLGISAGVAALVLVVAGGNFWMQRRADQVARLEGERKRLEPAVKQVKDIQEELHKVAGWDAYKGRELEALLAVVQALPGDDEAYLTELRWSERGLVLRGRAKSWQNVEEFFSELEQAPIVAAASVKSVGVPKERRALGVQFDGEVRLREPGAQATGGGALAKKPGGRPAAGRTP